MIEISESDSEREIFDLKGVQKTFLEFIVSGLKITFEKYPPGVGTAYELERTKYQRYEVLGDTIFRNQIVSMLLSSYPEASAKEISLMTAEFCSAKSQIKAAIKAGLDVPGANTKPGCEKSSTALADTFEVSVAEIHEIFGPKTLKKYIGTLFQDKFLKAMRYAKPQPVETLSIWASKLWAVTPIYELCPKFEWFSGEITYACKAGKYGSTGHGKTSEKAKASAARKIIEEMTGWVSPAFHTFMTMTGSVKNFMTAYYNTSWYNKRWDFYTTSTKDGLHRCELILPGGKSFVGINATHHIAMAEACKHATVWIQTERGRDATDLIIMGTPLKQEKPLK